MRCTRCGECCRETEMLLSEEDIKRLERKGYYRDFFLRLDNDGYAVLRNSNGVCIFFDPKERVCRERLSRPLGCRIYPVMLDEDKGIVIDDICPAKESITEKQKAKRGKKVSKLLKKIDAEAEKRREWFNESISRGAKSKRKK
jgi:Fe-S-cluster containining protein